MTPAQRDAAGAVDAMGVAVATHKLNIQVNTLHGAAARNARYDHDVLPWTI